MRAFILMLALAGCAAIGEPREGELERELAGRAAGEPQACVPANQNQSLRAVDDRTLVYRLGDTLWVNRLAGGCPGLRPMSSLIVEAHSGRFCRGDRVSGLEPGTSIPGAACPLGDFVPYRRTAGR